VLLPNEGSQLLCFYHQTNADFTWSFTRSRACMKTGVPVKSTWLSGKLLPAAHHALIDSG
jgi:hypothetical protein